jgi:hypothetical protein
MRAHILCACVAGALLSACTTGQANTTPPIATTTANPSNSTLKFAVGTVNFAGIGTGINVLETFRGSNGYSAVPINTATLIGPAGFTAPAGSKDPGSGAATVPLGSVKNQFVIGNVPGTGTILASADGFGIGPPSSSTAGQNFYPAQPQFADVTVGGAAFFPAGAIPIYGGQPAYPAAPLVPSALSSQLLIPSGWPEGFYIVALNAPAPGGTYTLNVSYTQNGANGSQTATASLNPGTVLPPLVSQLGVPLVSTASTGNGGATVTLAAMPPGVTEVIANVIDTNVPPAPGATCLAGAGVATVIFKSAGTQTIPNNLGQGGSPTFCTAIPPAAMGDLLATYAYGFDYDDAALGPPGNTSSSPSLPAQADVTIVAAPPTNE